MGTQVVGRYLLQGTEFGAPGWSWLSLAGPEYLLAGSPPAGHCAKSVTGRVHKRVPEYSQHVSRNMNEAVPRSHFYSPLRVKVPRRSDTPIA